MNKTSQIATCAVLLLMLLSGWVGSQAFATETSKPQAVPSVLPWHQSKHYLADHTEAKGSAFTIDTGIEGGWFFPPSSGQGFMMDFIPGDPDQLFVAWFTFESPGAQGQSTAMKIGALEHRWLSAQGPVTDNRAELTLFSSSGGVFTIGGGVTTAAVGSLAIEFASCREAVLDYQFDGTALSGQIQLEPLDPGRATCDQKSASRWRAKPAGRGSNNGKGLGFSIDSSIQGGWFLPSTSGQGFMMDHIAGNPAQLFLAWFTFESAAASKIGAQEHRWLTAQGPIDGNSATLTTFSTSGGIFDSGGGVVTDAVGSMSIAFSSCREAVLSYQFDTEQLSGDIPLQPLDPTRLDCDLTTLSDDPPDTCLPSATRLFNGSIITEEIKPATDVDFYRLVLDGSANVRAFSFGSLDTVGRLHNASCDALVSDDNGGAESNFDLSAMELTAGTYYVSVRSNIGPAACPGGGSLCKPSFAATGVYGLGIEIEDLGGGGPPDQFPDTCGTDTVLLGDGEAISGLIDPATDLDFFRVNVNDDGSTLRAFSSQSVDVLGRFYDASCNAIASDDNSGDGVNFDLSAPLAVGTYFVSVESGDGVQTGAYTLNIDIAPTVVAADDFPNTCDLDNSPILGDASSIAGAIEQAADLDFFRVDVTEDRTVLRASSRGDLDTVGRIYDTSCSEIALNDDSDIDANFDVSKVVDAGTFYVSVESFGGESTGDYILDVALTSAAGIEDDFPNTCDVANSPILVSGSTIGGRIEVPDDSDFFRFDVMESSSIRTFTTGNLDTVGRLFDASCQLIDENDDAFGSQNFELANVVDAGTYYVSVESFANADIGDYELNFEVLIGGVGPNDDFPNTCDAANSPLLGDGAMIAGAIDINNDRDFFRIDIDSDDVTLRAFTTGDMDTVGRLYDADCNEIAFNDDVFGTTNFELNVVLDPGTYYVSVESFANADTGDYVLNIEFLVGGVGANDDFPNTCDLENSLLVDDGDMIAGVLEINNDRDFFRIDITAPEVQLRAISISEIDTFGRLFDSACDQIAEDDDAFGTGDFELVVTVGPGTYYVSMESLGAQQSGDYVLAIDFLVNGAGPGDDFPNTCDFDNSPLLADGATIDGAIERVNDRDYFRIDLATGQSSIRAFSASDFDAFGRLYDASCNEIAVDDDSGIELDFELLVNNLAAGTYYVSIEVLNIDSTGSYTIAVDLN